jgi:phosphate:Na+ symporter
MGANVGTAVTAWLTGLSGIGDALAFFKPDTWIPLVAIAAVCMLMFVKRGKKRDIAFILMGFAILMVGMDMMSGAVSGLRDNETFTSILTMFENPLLGVLAGLVLTAIVQSSSASIGILQALTVTGAISFGSAIPIIMGQNIGTCVTAMISSINANKNGKRAALIHLYFNIIGVVVVLSLFYVLNAIFQFRMGDGLFVDATIDMWGVAAVHTIFKIISVALIAPFYRQLEALAKLTVRDKENDNESVNLLDERLIETPAFAVERATEVTHSMASLATDALKKSLALFDAFDAKLAEDIRVLEDKGDIYEDALGSYLVKISNADVSNSDSAEITKLLHIIGDFERISDHAVNIVESAEEMKEKNISFSDEATKELATMRQAISEILTMTEQAFLTNNVKLAADIEPLEQVVDDLRDKIKHNHILRLQKSECTIEHGFVLADLLTNLERVADHCSNIAGCVIEISTYDALDMHKYLSELRAGNADYNEKYAEYSAKYSI